MAGKSILNRLELTPIDADQNNHYKKIVADPEAMDNLLIDIFVESFETPPVEIVLDLDIRGSLWGCLVRGIPTVTSG